MKGLVPLYSLCLFLLCPHTVSADYITREDFGKKSQFDTSSSSSSYQSSWGWEGWNPNSNSSSSTSSSSGGGWRRNRDSEASPKPSRPAYDPRTDKRRVKKMAKKSFKEGRWDNAVAEAYSYLELTGWKDKKMVFMYARANQLEFLEWCHSGYADGTWDWRRDQAIAKYEKLLNIDPSNKEAKQHLAELRAMRKEDYHIKPSAAAIDYGNGHYRNGKNAIREERWDDAIESFRQAVNWNWTDHEAYGYIGWLLEKKGNLEEAIDAYKSAIKNGSKDAVIYSNLTHLYARFHRDEDVIQTGEQALSLDPQSAPVFDLVAKALDHLNRPAEAMLYYEKAFEIEPNNPKYISGMLGVHLFFNDFDEADALITRLEEIDPMNTDITYYSQRIASERQRQKDEEAAAEAAMLEESETFNAAQDSLVEEPLAPVLKEAAAVAEQSQKAARAETLEQAKTEAGVGFDTALAPAGETAVLIKSPADPVVLDSQKTEFIAQQEEAREQSRQKRFEMEAALKQIQTSDKPDVVAIAKLKQEVSDAQNNENFYNFLIAEELKKSGRDAAAQESAPEPPSEEISVTEMSVGGEALTEEDRLKSEKWLTEKKALWEANTRKAIHDYIRRGAYHDEIDAKVAAEIQADPVLKQAVETSDRLWREAEAEYDRRQNDMNTLPEESPEELFPAQQKAVRAWPGESNPEAPLPNPLEEDAKKAAGVSQIYAELRQREHFLSLFENMMDDLTDQQFDSSLAEASSEEQSA